MSNQRTVLCESISYIGEDGKSHVARRGDKVTVAAEDIQHFDWVHGATVEARAAVDAKKVSAGERAAAPVKKASVEK